MALHVVPLAIAPIVSAHDSPAAKLVAVFGVLFPVLVYAFLAVTWLMKPLASGLRSR